MVTSCFFCGQEITQKVNHVTYRYVGGQGDVPFPVCDDKQACIERVEVLDFECAYCPAKFKQFSELVEHYQKYHEPKADMRTVKQLDDLRAMREASAVK